MPGILFGLVSVYYGAYVIKDCLRNLALGCVLSTPISDEVKYFQVSLIVFSPCVVPMLESGNGELVAFDDLP